MSFKLKSVAVAALLLSSSIAFAGHNYKDASFKDAIPCPTPPTLMGGFYVGGQVGYDAYNVGENVNINASSSTGNPSAFANGWVGGLMLGYGQYFSNVYYLGGEIFGNYSNADQSWTGTTDGTVATYNSKVSVNGSYGLAILPGMKLSDSTLAYVRLGYNWSSVKYQENATAPAISASKTNTSGGFAYGLGMETLLATNWSVRGEYTYTDYNNFTTNMNATSATKVSPSDNQFMVGVLYHFS